jgi:hypothetical protein
MRFAGSIQESASDESMLVEVRQSTQKFEKRLEIEGKKRGTYEGKRKTQHTTDRLRIPASSAPYRRVCLL